MLLYNGYCFSPVVFLFIKSCKSFCANVVWNRISKDLSTFRMVFYEKKWLTLNGDGSALLQVFNGVESLQK